MQEVKQNPNGGQSPKSLYLMQNTVTKLLKIGFSSHCMIRKESVEAATGCKIDLLYIIPNKGHLEKQLHFKFKHLRKYGEWFEFSQSIIDEFEKLSEQTPVSVLEEKTNTKKVIVSANKFQEEQTILKFSQIPNALINDSNLSVKAKFIYIWMASKPDSWTFCMKDLQQGTGLSQSTLNDNIKALIKEGWIEKVCQLIDGNKFAGVKYIIHYVNNCPKL